MKIHFSPIALCALSLLYGFESRGCELDNHEAPYSDAHIDSICHLTSDRLATRDEILSEIFADGGKTIQYEVQRGDTWQNVAAAHRVDLIQLLCLNPFDTELYTGMVIDVPAYYDDDELKRIVTIYGNTNIDEADRLYKNGEFKKAAKLYTAVLNATPALELYYKRGLAYYKGDKLGQCISDMKRVIGEDKRGRFPDAKKIKKDAERILEERREARNQFWADVFNTIGRMAGEAANIYAQTQGYGGGSYSTPNIGAGDGSALNAEVPACLNPANYFNAATMQTVVTYDAAGNMMFSNPGLAAANNAMMADFNAMMGSMDMSGVSQNRINSLQAQMQSNNRFSQMMSDWWSTPTYAIPMDNSVSTSTTIGATHETASPSTSGYVADCHLCKGLGKCWTCFGTKTIEYEFGAGRLDCPNCTDGLCSACGGTGKKRRR